MAARPIPDFGVRVCEECRKLREAYWKAIIDMAQLECLNSGLNGEEALHLDAQIEVADQARRAARDMLQTHRIEKWHTESR